MPDEQTQAQTTAPVAGSAAVAQEAAFNVDAIEKKLFGADEKSLSDAGVYLGKIQAIVDASKVTSNFNLQDENAFPAGYGILVLPVKQRNEKEGKNELVSVCFAAVPTFEMAMADAKGREYIAGAFTDAMASKIAASVRGSLDGEATPLPISLTDFIERRVRGDSLKSFNEIKKALVQSLRSAGLKTLTAQILRLTLSNAHIAETQFPAVPQERWVQVLDFASAYAQKKGFDPQIFAYWKNTRDTATTVESEIDFAKLDDLLAA